jgi:phage shock protein E
VIIVTKFSLQNIYFCTYRINITKRINNISGVAPSLIGGLGCGLLLFKIQIMIYITFFIIFALFLIYKIYPMLLNKNSNFENIDNATFKKITFSDKNSIILDVRTSAEYKKGNISNSLNIDVLQKTFESKVRELDKEKPYLVYCRSGMRSAKAAALLCNLGFKKVYNLKKGYNSWV